LAEARADLQKIDADLREHGVPDAVHPLTVGITGYGNVSGGAQEILKVLPVEPISPADLSRVAHDRLQSRKLIYKVVFREGDLAEPLEGRKSFDLNDYYRCGKTGYRGIFERYLDHLTVLVNCIYWDERYPRLLTRDQCRRLWAPGRRPKLTIIGDISCDVNGSIECTVKATEPGNPVYIYDPATGEATDGFDGRGPVMMAVDILPAEIPRESSVDFSRVLSQLLPQLAKADFSKDFERLLLPAELKGAVIVYKGELTPDYAYLKSFL
jgi:alpha-aminoadipic semialdehyde synthase